MAPAGGKIITLLRVAEAAAKLRPEVTIQRRFCLASSFPTLTCDSATWLYSVFNTPWSLHGEIQPPSYQDYIHNSNFVLNKLPKFLQEGKLRPSKIKVWDNGLDDLGEGMEYMASGKVNAEKLVFKLPN